MNIIRNIKNWYGKPKTAVIAFSCTVLAIYIYFIWKFNDNLTLESIYKFYNNDISNIAGVLAGFVFTSLGVLLSIENNSTIKKLKITNNISVINEILLATVLCFTISIIIYFLKDLIIVDYAYIVNFSTLKCTTMKIILLLGLYSFANAFVLFLFTLYILKKILVNKTTHNY